MGYLMPEKIKKDVDISNLTPEELTYWHNNLHVMWKVMEGGGDFIDWNFYDLYIYHKKIIFLMMTKEMKHLTPINALDTATEDYSYFFDLLPKGPIKMEVGTDTETLAKEEKMFSVEEKLNGFHATFHKKGNEVKIFSEQEKDITVAFPSIIENINKLNSGDFIIDGELVPYDEEGNTLGRNELMKFMGSIKSGKKADDSNVKAHIWDIIYLNKDLKDLPLSERINILNELDFNKKILEVKRQIVSTEGLEKSVNWAASIKGSEGTVVKDTNAKYHFGEDASWKKYRHLSELNVLVLKKIPKERGVLNYLIGVSADKEGLDPKYILENKGSKILVLGHTFNTKQEFEIGDKISILIEEVWRHESAAGNHYSLHKPRVKEKTDKLSNINNLEDLVTSIGVTIKHSIIDDIEILESNTGTEYIELSDTEGREVNPIDFPREMQDSFRNSIGKSFDYVLQWHYRGHTISDEDRKSNNIPDNYKWWLKSLHTDNRFDNTSDKLMGVTLLSPTSTDKNVPDLVNSDLKNVRGVLKLPQPKEWLGYEGIRHLGEAGTTSNAPAVIIIVGKGKYTPLEIEDHKLVMEFIPEVGKVNLNILKEAEKSGIYIDRLPDENLKQLPKKVSYHIAHIGENHIILVDKLKE